MKILLTLILAAVLAPPIPYAAALEARQDTPVDLKDVAITLERTACEGFCPAYQVSITGDGKVRYFGQSNVSLKGEHFGSMDPKLIQDLVAEAKRISFLSLATCDIEKTMRIADAPRLTVSVWLARQMNTVMSIQGFCPAQKNIYPFADQIDKAVKSVKWK